MDGQHAQAIVFEHVIRTPADRFAVFGDPARATGGRLTGHGGSGAAMARIVDHLPVEELEARYRAARDAAEARHLQAIWPPAQGRTVLETAEVSALVPRWVEQLAARHNASGPTAPGDQRRGTTAGRPAC